MLLSNEQLADAVRIVGLHQREISLDSFFSDPDEVDQILWGGEPLQSCNTPACLAGTLALSDQFPALGVGTHGDVVFPHNGLMVLDSRPGDWGLDQDEVSEIIAQGIRLFGCRGTGRWDAEIADLLGVSAPFRDSVFVLGDNPTDHELAMYRLYREMGVPQKDALRFAGIDPSQLTSQ